MPEGVRKYRAFLFSLLCITVMSWTDRLTPTYVEALGWILSVFILGNAAVHTARSFGKQGQVPQDTFQSTVTTETQTKAVTTEPKP